MIREFDSNIRNNSDLHLIVNQISEARQIVVQIVKLKLMEFTYYNMHELLKSYNKFHNILQHVILEAYIH